MINAATVTLIFSARYISFGLQQIKLDKKANAHEKSEKVLSGTGSKTHWPGNKEIMNENLPGS